MSSDGLTGQHLVCGEWRAFGATRFRAVDPSTDTELEPAFVEAGDDDVDAAVGAAVSAWADARELQPVRLAELLTAIASELEFCADALIARAAQETGLPHRPRLAGELGRTTGQLRLFAQLIVEGSWVDAVIETAQPRRVPAPRPDIRRMLRPIGPVAVFGASNFPFAFGTMGGDTVSALAAGNPVVVKGHPGHPGVNELVAQATQAALMATDLPAGLFSLLQGAGNAVGERLVVHPSIAAVGFTGSLRGGRALFDLAARRPRPIPVYAEMGSVNPLVLLPGALAERGADIVKATAASITLGAGQFCTKPGLILVQDGADADRFIDGLSSALATTPQFTLLNERLQRSLRDTTEQIASVSGVSCQVLGAFDAAAHAGASLFSVDSGTWRREPALHQEAFGPAAIVVRCTDIDDLLLTVSAIEGTLTGSVHFGDGDTSETIRSAIAALEQMAGRVICNGMPTGVEVGHAMVHGGPYPATTASASTSVGTLAIRRFARPIAYQDVPDGMLPDALRNANTAGILRHVDGEYTRAAL